MAGACITLATLPAYAQPARDPNRAPALGAQLDAGVTDAGGPAAASVADVQPPSLITDVPAIYPEAAKAERLEGRVLLRLTIDAQGKVTDAEVLEPAGHGFDEAARSAALQLAFEPARRHGEAVPSKIRYPVEFRLAPPAVAPGAVEGQCLIDGVAAAGATLTLTPSEAASGSDPAPSAGSPAASTSAAPSAPPTAAPASATVPSSASGEPTPSQPVSEHAAAPALTVTTNADGRFRFDQVPPGSWRLRAQRGERSAQLPLVVSSGQTTQLSLAFEPAPAEPVVAAAQPAAAVDVTVAGQRNEGERLQQSAAAVNVIDTRRAQRQTADLGEVLARSQGVAVRRYGGLGTSTRFSLNGLYDEQVRFFMDEIPLDIAGFTLGVSNVPVNLVERAEVYRGVVPVRFGADALGGAVNLVTDQRYRPHLAASYQVGSFGTHRVSLDGRYRHAATGFVAGVTSFFDTTKNNYDVDVEVTDDKGRIVPATLPRFHDAYTAVGATLEAGVVDRSWAKRLIVRGILSSYEKELQHNIVMKVPYGEVHYGETVYGTSLRYDVAPVKNLELEAVASYVHRSIDYSDQSEWVYDWYGAKVRRRREPGEVETRPHDQTEWQHSVYGRALAVVSLVPGHKLRASFSPAFATRSGDERIQSDPKARDPLTAQRDLFTFVSGIEYDVSLLDDRIANVLFVKDYYYQANSEEPLPGGIYRKRDTTTHTQGVGDSLRVRIAPWLYAKASYEYATRLPSPNEVFGNGVQIRANLALEPEVSHNANLGPRLELTRTPWGDLTVDINAFWRHSDKLIVLLGNDRYFTYQNVYLARGLGLENALSWSAPGRWLSLDGTFTWQDTRNLSTQGTFKMTKNDRIPNRPYMFASWGARGRLPAFTGAHDTIEPFYNGRYVHSFFRGWESLGIRDLKPTVDSQVTHAIGVSWTLQRDYASVTTTFEIDNLTDAKVYDNFGVQRPGRAFYIKVTGDLR